MTPPHIPNATVLRFLEARGIDIGEIRRRISAGFPADGDNAAPIEIDGVPMIIRDGCVFIAEPPTTKLKLEIGGSAV